MADYPNVIENFTSDLALGFKVCRLIGSYRYYLNKVWDPGGPGGGRWVVWETFEPDREGEDYSDPFGTGFSGTTGYRFARYRYR